MDNTGDTVISFTVDDGNGGVITPTVTIQPVNPGPDAIDQTVVTTPDTPIDIDPLANDNDPDSDPLTITEINGIALTPGVAQTIALPNGTVTVAVDGTITVTPDTGFAGDINVPYTIEDQDGATDSAVHRVTIGNAPPEVMDPDPTPGTPSVDPLDAENIIVPAVDGQPVTIDLDDYLADPNGHALTITPGTLPAGATFNPANNELTFVPTVDNTGDTVISFTVDDGNGGVITPTVTIQPVNPGPDAVDQTVVTTPDTPVVIDPQANDTDPDNDPLTITEINGIVLTPGVAQTIAVPNGTVTLAADGTITVTPDMGFAGDIDIPYTIEDQDSAGDSAVHTVEVPNTAPTLVDIDLAPGTPSVDPLDPMNIIVPAVDGTSLTIDLDEFLTDPNGQPLTIIPGALPAGATFTPATNELTFVPPIDNTSDTVIAFTVDDGNGGTITPTITIQPVNPGPDAVSQSVIASPDTPVIIDPLADDIDPDSDPLTITEIDGIALTPGVAQTIAVSNGTVTIAANGTITVTPDAGFAGNVNVPYTIEDQDGASDSAVHTVVVPNTPPDVVSPGTAPGAPSVDPLNPTNILVPAVDGTLITLDLNDYLTDPNSDVLTITPDTLPVGATFDPLTNIVSFEPSIDNVGDTVITFTVTDSNGGMITPTVTIQPVNPGPVATAQTVPGAFDTPTVIDPLANDSDPDNDTLAITEINGVALVSGMEQTISVPNGVVTLSIDGVITVTPDSGYSGDINVPYTVVDVDGASDTAIHTVSVPNAPVIAVAETVAGAFDAPTVIEPLANDTAANGGPLAITEINGVALISGMAQSITVPNGTVTVAADGTISVTPDEGFVGAIDVPYTLASIDGVNASAVHTVEIANPPPVVRDLNTQPGTPVVDPLDPQNILVPALDGEAVTIDLNDFLVDPNGDPLTIVPETLPEGASYDEVAQTLTFIPAVDNMGDVSVPFSVTDASGNVVNPTLTIQPVNPAPIANPESIVSTQGIAVTLDLLANDTDPDGDEISLAEPPILLDPATGTLQLLNDEWVFTPAAGFTGDAVISYILQDQDGLTSASFHTVTVGPAAPAEAQEARPIVNVESPIYRPTRVSESNVERDYYKPSIDAELVVLQMSESLRSLNGSDLSTTDGHDQPTVVNVTYAESAGFSSGKGYRGTHSIDPTDECGRVFVDTIVRDSMLSITVRSTIDPVRSSGVIAFGVTLDDGQPLPDWISELADDEFMVDRQAGVEMIALKVVAHQEDGTDRVRFVEIDTLTGHIRERSQGSTLGTGFIEELEQVVSNDEMLIERKAN